VAGAEVAEADVSLILFFMVGEELKIFYSLYFFIRETYFHIFKRLPYLFI